MDFQLHVIDGDGRQPGFIAQLNATIDGGVHGVGGSGGGGGCDDCREGCTGEIEAANGRVLSEGENGGEGGVGGMFVVGPLGVGVFETVRADVVVEGGVEEAPPFVQSE